MTTEATPANVRCNDGLAVVAEAKKACTRCGEVKALAEFHRNQRKCKPCRKAEAAARRLALGDEARRLDAERYRARKAEFAKAIKAYRQRHKEDVQRWNRESKAKDRAELGPRYLARTIGLPLSMTPADLLELKRQQLTAHRLARQLKEANHESSKDPR